MSFGWSAGDLVDAIRLLVSVAASLKEAGGAKERYQQESACLTDLASTLQYLTDHGSDLPRASEGVDTLKKSIERFVKRLSMRFGNSLGSDSSTNRQSLIEKVKDASRMIQYGLFVSREVDELHRRIDIPLKRAIVGLGIDNNKLITQAHQTASQTHSVLDDLTISMSNLSATALASEEQTKTLFHGSCEWLFDRDEFAFWRSKDKIHDRYRMLWIMDQAGAGKTHLAARVIEQLKQSETKLAYFYCDAKDDRRKFAISILRNWSWQLLQEDPFLLDDIVSIIAKMQLASKTILEDILFTTLQRLEDLILVVDGFDECEAREQVKLYRIFDRFSRYARILVFRRTFSISDQLIAPEECFILYDISEDDNSADIHRYIVEGVANLEIDDNNIRRTIDATLRSGANGMFLWVALMIEELRKPLFSDTDYLETLKYLPEDLNTLYLRILQGLSSRPREFSISRNLLQLMASVIHERPDACPTVTLVHSSLQEFLFEPQEGDGLPPLKTNRAQAHLALTHICLTYLGYDDVEAPPYNVLDEEGTQKDTDTISWDSITMRTCMESKVAGFLEKYPLLEYSSLHWWWHFARSSSSIETYNLLLRLCRSSRKTVRWLQIIQYFLGDRGGWGSSKDRRDLEEIVALRKVLPAEDTIFSTWLKSFGREHHSRSNLSKWQNFLLSGTANDFLPEIHVAAYFDFVQLVEDYLLEGVNVNQGSHTRQSPLTLAVLGDSFNSMRVLLRYGADVNAKGWQQLTPLRWTGGPVPWPALHPVPYIAGQILLDAGARISPDCNQNFLALVCQNSSPENPFCVPFVSSLLEHGAKTVIDQGDPRPAIHWAAICGNAPLVKLLLEHGAKHDSSPKGASGREAIIRGDHSGEASRTWKS